MQLERQTHPITRDGHLGGPPNNYLSQPPVQLSLQKSPHGFCRGFGTGPQYRGGLGPHPAHLVELRREICHLLLDLLVLAGLLFQLLLHLVQRLHHFFLLLGFGIALPLLLLQLLLKLAVL